MAEKKERKKKPDCFIIMPITTPSDYFERYPKKGHHFRLICNHLFVPAVKNAGFEPVLPEASGSVNIQARIIEQLIKADLVLCDISIYNPNVFFELGVRTALDKSICLVRDNHTSKVPFDNTTINVAEYNSDLSIDVVPKQIEIIKDHILQTYDNNDGHNVLWKYFGITIKGEEFEGQGDQDDKYEYIKLQLEKINKSLNNQIRYVDPDDIISPSIDSLRADIIEFMGDLKQSNAKISDFYLQDNLDISITLNPGFVNDKEALNNIRSKIRNAFPNISNKIHFQGALF